MRILKLLIFCSFFLAHHVSFSQSQPDYFAVTMSGGIMNYAGDLVAWQQSFQFKRPAASVGIFYKFDPLLAFRLSATHGSLIADDAKNPKRQLRKRNLNFYTPLTALDAHLVFDFVQSERPYYRRSPLIPYVFAGISVFAFNPQAELNGEYIELQPLGTEGQNLTDPDGRYPDPYSLVQLAVPLGIGFRYRLGQNWDISAEIGYRKTFTDYLDDTSTTFPNMQELLAQNQTAFILADRTNMAYANDGRKLSDYPNSIRGNKHLNDGIFQTNVTVSYIIDVVRCPK